MEYITYLLTTTKIQIFKENDLTQNKLDLIIEKDNNEHTILKYKYRMRHQKNHRTKYIKKLRVGPPMLTTRRGFGRGENSSCHALAALRRAAESI
jgi:hypothetical protein